MLQALGLDQDVERVYRALLEHPGFGVAELVDHLALSEIQIRESLDALADLTLLQASRQDPGRWRPVTLDRAASILLRRQEEEAERRHRELQAGFAAMRGLVADYANLRVGEAHPDAERLIGLDAIQARMEQITHTAKSACRSVVPGGAVAADALEASRSLDAELMARSVTQYVLYQDGARTDPVTLAYGRWMIEQGAQVRTAPVLPPRMLIVDDATALVPLDPTNTRAGAVAVSAPGVVASLVSLFEQNWNAAVSLDAEQARDATTGLISGEQELLKLLAAGLTDEVAARRLGVSLRTVRRRMEVLMDRLGASSRFEAGMKAKERGWL